MLHGINLDLRTPKIGYHRNPDPPLLKTSEMYPEKIGLTDLIIIVTREANLSEVARVGIRGNGSRRVDMKAMHRPIYSEKGILPGRTREESL